MEESRRHERGQGVWRMSVGCRREEGRGNGLELDGSRRRTAQQQSRAEQSRAEQSRTTVSPPSLLSHPLPAHLTHHRLAPRYAAPLPSSARCHSLPHHALARVSLPRRPVCSSLSCRSSLSMSTSSPSFSADEVRHRESVLLRCFQCCDCNCDGVIDGKELEAVARAFTLTNSHSHHPAANAANSSAAANGSAAPSTSTSTSHSSSTGMNVDQEVKVILGKLDKATHTAHTHHITLITHLTSPHATTQSRPTDGICAALLLRLDVVWCLQNGDGVIDVDEWTAVLFDLFRFMSAGPNSAQHSTAQHRCSTSSAHPLTTHTLHLT